MFKKINHLVASVTVFSIIFMGFVARAQEAAAGGAAPAADGAAAQALNPNPGFYEIVFKAGIINLVVWVAIFLTSAATVALIIDAFITIKKEKMMPDDLVEGVRESLKEGNLDSAIESCENNPCPLSNILMVGFANITEGYEVIQEAVGAATTMESEKMMQRVNYLNVCGQVAPMLGLLGTVIGMVMCFASLASATGAAKSTMLAVAIGTALWTTVAGLLIAIPALMAYTLVKNYATRLLLSIEATVLDLIKVLRNAEVEEQK